MKHPGPDHPIVTEAFSGSVSVALAGSEIARSDKALALNEASYPTVYYIPRADIVMAGLQRSEKVTYCPYKGDAAHFSVVAGGEAAENAAWSYEQPYGAVAAIAEYLAFYADKVDITATPD
jgi:uncharacterized protein (DUF427 family)